MESASVKGTYAESLQAIQTENKVPPPSPKKVNKTVRCAILTKSPLKSCRTGQMFTMTLCDRDPSTTLKGVCFDENLFQQLQPKKTYDMKNYKVKKAFGREGLEIQIDDDTNITESVEQFKIEHSSFNISQVVRGEAENVKLITVKGKVLIIGDVETVGIHPDTKLKREVTIADETGQINIIFWREMANTINFQKDDVIKVENAYVSKFNHLIHLTYNSQTVIEKLNESIEVGHAIGRVKEKTPQVASLRDYITAYKDFKCHIRCVNCNKETELTDQHKQVQANRGYIVKCSTCATTFLGTITNAVNECKFKIGDQWCIARQKVVQMLFGRDTPSVKEPSKEENIFLISRKFCLRIKGNKIEDATQIQDDLEHDDDDVAKASKKAKVD